jgi:nicotinate phosphoribosyltransferase
MIINSLLDTNFCKFTTACAIFYNYSGIITEYHFKDKINSIKADDFLDRINCEIDHLCSLSFSNSDINFLNSLNVFNPLFLGYLLQGFKLNRDYIRCSKTENGGISIIIKGPWKDTIFFETPVLSIINELYCKHQLYNNTISVNDIMAGAINKRKETIDLISSMMLDVNGEENYNGLKFVEYGTDNRFSFLWHEDTLKKFIAVKGKNAGLIGTSNLFFAKELNITPISTMPYEWLQTHQSLYPNLNNPHSEALKVWAKTFYNKSGIILDVSVAMSDTTNFNSFLKSFDFWTAMVYSGVKYSSYGNVEWTEDLIKHYYSIGLSPKFKQAIFGNNITFNNAIELLKIFNNKIETVYEIGTDITNNIPNIHVPNINIEMIKCES